MPKLKSNRGAAKRFKPTGTGRFKHRQSFKNHILTKKLSLIHISEPTRPY